MGIFMIWKRIKGNFKIKMDEREIQPGMLNEKIILLKIKK